MARLPQWAFLHGANNLRTSECFLSHPRTLNSPSRNLTVRIPIFVMSGRKTPGGCGGQEEKY
ncbi:hypothetical protein COMA2_20210 [Candidatus Nitrospira nitrificans]|uniref:Uncharacterized protein n=1 Tax=Candidatus Nitrospira nitrificans TaxID=1742973 RepID=A0A0S4LFA1_9BACT|nr:hypothetical protein COMA2_20210 [Candidatus Nitrospira nitrificans]